MSTCPLCSVATTKPHESHEDCIGALQEEIARVRAVLEHVQSSAVPDPDEPE